MAPSVCRVRNQRDSIGKFLRRSAALAASAALILGLAGTREANAYVVKKTTRGEVDETTWGILTDRLCRNYDY